MREIKFRAWDKLQKKMGEVSFIDFDESIVGITHAGVLEYDEVPSPDAVLLQYTGLKDVHGIEIYEGDIVNVTWQRDDGEGENYAIAYDPNNDGYPAFELVDWYEDVNGLSCAYIDGQITVIGNRFENAELLEDK